MNNLQTNRLSLRQLTLDDTDALLAILSDPATMQYYPAPYDRKGTIAWIERSITSYETNDFGLWAVMLKEGDTFIGQCGISMQDINGKLVPEIGYHINREFWNNGYATEAAGECLKTGFTVYGLEELFIHTSVENVPSRRVAEKVGMSMRYEYDKKILGYDMVIRHVVFSTASEK